MFDDDCSVIEAIREYKLDKAERQQDLYDTARYDDDGGKFCQDNG